LHGRRAFPFHAFLESRGIRLPEGRPDDPPSAETAYGLAMLDAARLMPLIDARVDAAVIRAVARN
jgi:hypothetical protein